MNVYYGNVNEGLEELKKQADTLLRLIVAFFVAATVMLVLIYLTL